MADDKTRQDGVVLKNINRILTSLSDISGTTNYSTYKVNKDLFATSRMLDDLALIQKNNEDTVKKTVEGNNFAKARVNSFGLQNNKPSRQSSNDKNDTKPNSIFDVVQGEKSLFTELRQQMLMNNKFNAVISDYEILRRAIPEVSRVINLLINSVLIPEVITSNTFNLDYTFGNNAHTQVAKRLKEKYEIDKKIRVIVENYFVNGVEYVTVIPYKAVVDSIKRNTSKSNIIKESTLEQYSNKSKILTESAFMSTLSDELRQRFKSDEENSKNGQSQLRAFEDELNKYIDSIKISHSNKSIVYDDALIETIKDDKGYLFESSFETAFEKDMKKSSKGDPGVVDTDKEYDKLKIQGCKIERLDPSRVYPLTMHDTVIAYVYIEERRDETLQFNLQNQMRNAFSFYRVGARTTSMDFTMKMIEDRMIKEIGNRVISSLSPKFLEANFKDMDMFYEFLRDRDLHKNRHDIIMIHPDDIVEFKRSDGSIMKNAVFFARLYLMMVLNNILTKVRKGSDRTLYYVSNGLSNDIEGSVMEAIEAIQQSEIRISDVGTIAGIMGSVGSVVDLFVPQSADGTKPINPDVIAGQQVEMDEEFLKYLIKSIILSFNVPSVAVDLTNEVEFAKTLSMANLDIATSSALTQSELNPQLTTLIKQIIRYELEITDDEAETIKATLIPSRSMLMQITNELLTTTKDLATSMADINLVQDNDTLKKLFIKEFCRKYLNYEWNEIDEIIKKIEELEVENELQIKAKETGDTTSEEDFNDMADNMGS